ncbi:hypothetical protein C8R46DRAFT_1294973 [Mycena filopes]|nr:hypothetical protein C8R46DRAFT_1294973 [Mycena filopes]
MRFDELREELARIEAALSSSQPDVDTSALTERKTAAKLQLDSVGARNFLPAQLKHSRTAMRLFNCELVVCLGAAVTGYKPTIPSIFPAPSPLLPLSVLLLPQFVRVGHRPWLIQVFLLDLKFNPDPGESIWRGSTIRSPPRIRAYHGDLPSACLGISATSYPACPPCLLFFWVAGGRQTQSHNRVSNFNGLIRPQVHLTRLWFDDSGGKIVHTNSGTRICRSEAEVLSCPVLTLPGEITSDIFAKCVDSETPFNFQADEVERFRLTSLATEAPLLLLQICRTWRSIALGTPALWVNLGTGHRLFTTGRADVSAETIAHGVDRWLRCASALPVSLSLYATDSANDTWFKAVRNLLRAHASRLRSLSLLYNLDVSALGEPVHFPILRSLTVHRVFSDALIRTFQATPQLREVCFAVGSVLRPRQIAPPWPQLTAFTAHHLPISDCLQILHQCPLLTSLTLSGLDDTVPRRSLVVHEHLEKLSISHPSADITQLLDLPALRALTLKEVTFDGAGLLAFLRRSSRSLRVFTCKDDPQSGVSAITLEWFYIAKDLREVTLSGLSPDIFSALFSALDHTAHPKFLPRLCRLELAIYEGLTVDAPVIAALQSRLGPAMETKSNTAARVDSEANGVPLKSLKLVVPCSEYDLSWDELGSIDWDALYDLGMDGMEIYVGSDKENFLWEW